jgi:uncharacterized integral membrane protein
VLATGAFTIPDALIRLTRFCAGTLLAMAVMLRVWTGYRTALRRQP